MGRLRDGHLHTHGPLAADDDHPSGIALRCVGPIDLDPVTPISADTELLGEKNPRLFGSDLKLDGARAHRKDVDIRATRLKRIEGRQCGARVMVRPRERAALDRHAQARFIGRSHFDEGGHRIDHRRLPVELAEVSLIHEVIPLPAGKLVVVGVGQRAILAEQLAHLRGEPIGGGAALFGEQVVATGGNVHCGDDRRGLGRMQDELEERIALLGGQHRVKLLGALGDVAPGGLHAVGLVVVKKTEGLRLDQLGFPPAVVFRVERDDVGDLAGMLRTEVALGPAARVVGDLIAGVGGGIPGHPQEKLDREFERLEIADVDDPDAGGPVLGGQVHLLGDLPEWIGVDPLVGVRAAVHVEVVVDAGAAAAAALVGRGQSPEVAGVVVSPEQGDIVRRAEAGLVEFLHLGEQSPKLRHRGRIDLHLFGEDAPLIGENFFQLFDIGLDASGADHALVAIAAHADSDEILEVLVARDAFAEEALERLGVRRIIPLAVAVLGAARGPLLVRTHHGLVMRGSHDDAVLVGQAGIERVVLVEGVVPHRRPEVVGAQTQQQLEDLGVKLRVEAAELLRGPTGQARSLVVEEDAAVFHDRLAGDVAAGAHVGLGAFLRRHVGPPVPGRDAELFGKFVEAVDRAALVAARDHQCTGDARHGRFDGGNDKRLPLARKVRGREFSGKDELVDQRAAAQGPGNHHGITAGLVAGV
ncbi:MAG: hypothetical protein BWX86_01161 [Verrucomicrobia bacterium ADurb.Bin122]|nr:MAG: hypothetical protein BWX86_01161 [Verrucomicrobia bacterium ADurb.Bin122]